MQLVVVSNYFPPCSFGGYELGCRDVVERLRARGHGVTVLTSDYRAAEAPADPNVSRSFPLDDGEKFRPLWHLRSVLIFLRAAFTARPDVVYFWNQAGLSLWLAPVAQLFGFHSAFFLSDTSFPSWKVAAFLGAAGRRITKGTRCHFASRFLQQLDAPNESGLVIHWGIDPKVFRDEDREPRPEQPLRLLYLGQIIPEKGVHVAIDAAEIIAKRDGADSVHLTIVGGSSKPDYLRELQASVGARGLNHLIDFAGKRDRAELPRLYHAHDILILPSIWEEPFAITPLEAMACGVPVVATSTGGSAEIFRDRENAMVVPAGDAEACASAILELQSDRALYMRIRERARALVTEEFTIDGMVDRIERDLEQVAKS